MIFLMLADGDLGTYAVLAAFTALLVAAWIDNRIHTRDYTE